MSTNAQWQREIDEIAALVRRRPERATPLERRLATAKCIFYVDPAGPASVAPVIDPLTCKVVAAFVRAERIPGGYCGFHDCDCGARSDTTDFLLPSGCLTNSLAAHYVAFHRGACDAADLAIAAGWTEIVPEDVARGFVRRTCP